MRQRSLRRRATLAITAAALMVSALVATAPTAVASTTMQFTGAGRALTADVAIQSATWDAEASAQSMGFFDCTLVGEPMLFEGTDPLRGNVVRAEVTIECTS
jgi:hypothetical protein